MHGAHQSYRSSFELRSAISGHYFYLNLVFIMARREELSDEQWAIVAPLIPPAAPRADERRKPKEQIDRAILNGILWVLRTGAAWRDLPKRFPPGLTCFRRFSRWIKTGAMRQILEALAQQLEQDAQIDLAECFVDGTFVVARKGEPKWERPSAATARSSWVLLTLMIFHSPCTRFLLAHMTSPLSELPSMRPTLWDTPDVLAGILPSSSIRGMRHV